MNSRERILATLHRKPVDRLPVDLGGTRQTGIAARAYHRLDLIVTRAQALAKSRGVDLGHAMRLIIEEREDDDQ